MEYTRLNARMGVQFIMGSGNILEIAWMKPVEQVENATTTILRRVQ